jgi:hypothetical protein
VEELYDPIVGLLSVHVFVDEEHLDDLSFDVMKRVQGAKRLLKNHGDLIAPDPL